MVYNLLLFILIDFLYSVLSFMKIVNNIEFTWELISNTFFLYVIAGVQSAAVNVICELARKNPKNYLSLAPLFFKLMTSSTNNWMLIKIIKLVRN